MNTLSLVLDYRDESARKDRGPSRDAHCLKQGNLLNTDLFIKTFHKGDILKDVEKYNVCFATTLLFYEKIMYNSKCVIFLWKKNVVINHILFPSLYSTSLNCLSLSNIML